MLVGIVGAFAILVAPAFAASKFYVLKHPKREHCKAHYAEKTQTIKIRGHKRKQAICIYVTPKSTAPSGNPQSPTPQIQFTFTSREGWQYAGLLPFPQSQVTFSTSVSSSPPGYAKLVISLHGDDPNHEYSDLNPGRPNGPRLEIETGHLVYPVERVEHPPVTKQGEPLTGPCEWAGTSVETITAEHESPFSLEVRCWLLQQAQGIEMSGDVPEDEVHTLVTELQHVTPWYEFGFKLPGEAADTGQCDYYVTSAGQVMEAAEFAHFACQAATVSVIQ